jgi:hypothetical protein
MMVDGVITETGANALNHVTQEHGLGLDPVQTLLHITVVQNVLDWIEKLKSVTLNPVQVTM